MTQQSEHSTEQEVKFPLKASMTSKGQVTIPIKIREKFKMMTGDEIIFDTNDKDELVVKIEKKPSLLSLLGAVRTTGSLGDWENTRKESQEELADKISLEGKEE